MNLFSILKFLGGLAMFLYGMHVMSDSLALIGGGKMERVLERTTGNRFKGMMLGAGVTAVIQSSSATTVMVVGFVNSGMMKLRQAIGIIIGANIGTTVTAWILSLTGIEGSNVFVKLLQPSSFAPVLAIIGIVMILFSKRESKRDIGTILVGFAILMFGMGVISDTMRPLASVPEFTNLLLMFENPIMGVLLGTLITAIIQSSSASVGILQALSVSGAVTYGIAIPIIVGQNIGTCVTALISCIGANKNAKRAAMVHLYFNIIGAILFLSIFYLADAMFRFSFMELALVPADIAIIHTAFNLISSAVMLPFANLLEKLAILTIPDKPEPQRATMLDERFLDTPSFALEQCRTLVAKMADLAKNNLLLSLSILEKYDAALGTTILENEKQLDEYEDIIGTFLVKLSGKEFSERDSREVGNLLHMIGDFERIGDHAVNLCESAEEINRKKISFSQECIGELAVLFSVTRDVLSITFDAYLKNDTTLAESVDPLEEVIDLLQSELRERHIHRLTHGECTIELGFILADIISNIERVSDHCANISSHMIQLSNDSFAAHKYHRLSEQEKDFPLRVEELMKKYALPAPDVKKAPTPAK